MSCALFARLFALPIMIALLLRAFVPVGYMPNLSGPFHLVICSPEGHENITAADKYNPATPVKQSLSKTICDFAPMHSFVFSFVPLIFALTLLASLAEFFVLRRQVYLSPRYILAQSRAPPVFI